jgi:hypothetical protein
MKPIGYCREEPLNTRYKQISFDGVAMEFCTCSEGKGTDSTVVAAAIVFFSSFSAQKTHVKPQSHPTL